MQAPPGASSSLSLTIETTADQVALAQPWPGDAARVHRRRTIVLRGIARRPVHARGEGVCRGRSQRALDRACRRFRSVPAGFGEDESLIPFSARSHPAYRLLTEYFCFPEKFNFFDIDLAALCAALPAGARKVTLHLALSGLRTDSNTARMLGTLSANNVLLGCTPVVNLFRQRGEPIQLTHTSESYPVLADGRRAFAFEVHSIDSVSLVRQTPQGDSVVEFGPFYSLAARPDAGKQRPLLGDAARRCDGRQEPGLRDGDLDRRHRLRPGRGGNRHAQPGADVQQPRPAGVADLRPAAAATCSCRPARTSARSASCASRARPTASSAAAARTGA